MGIRRLIGVVVATVVLLLLSASPVLAWANGEFNRGYGAHDWVLQQANRIAGSEGWVNLSVALPMTDDPDYGLQDWPHHAYDVWGTTEGDAPDYIAGLYATAVSQLKAGDTTGASRTVGLLAHYFADINQPMHTDASSAESSLLHTRYELKVDTYTKSSSMNASWVVFDGIPASLDVKQHCIAAATTAHASYTKLVSTYRSSGYNSTVAGITKSQLNRAANRLADIIAHIKRAAQ